MADQWTPETPWFGGDKETQAHWPTYVCRNPNCKSRGKSHPNCHCGAPSFSRQAKSLEYEAHGGSICSKGLAHDPGCEYYDVGGPVQPAMAPQVTQDDTENTLGMAAVHHGLLGLLKDVGHPKMAEPEKHIQKIHKLRNKPEKLNEEIHEHPLAGGASKSNLEPIMHRMSGPLMSAEPHPEGIRASIDYLNSSMKGENRLSEQMNHLFGKGKMDVREDKESREMLKEHLQMLKEDPNKMLEVGGHLGTYLPEHGTAIAYQSAVATKYLESIKPQTQQLAPLDTEESVDKMAQAAYDRQVDIAQDPVLVLQHIKDGTLLPSDIQTIQTIYPGLHKALVKRAGAKLIETKSKDMEIPYKQKMTLSMLLGQPLDFTQSPTAAQAIMGASGPIQNPQAQGKGSKSKSGATGPELKQLNKVDEMSETPLEARLINKNSR